MTVAIAVAGNTEVNITYTHISGCSYSSSFEIDIRSKEESIYIPNIFSPDGSGSNDEWIVTTTTRVEMISCQIYDRWGSKVYHTDHPSELRWDGSYRGQPVVQGVYVYHIQYRDGNGEIKSIVGDVTVLR
jgi:gliding motility-associated-like protein